jgi:hypothetical protein
VTNSNKDRHKERKRQTDRSTDRQAKFEGDEHTQSMGREREREKQPEM